MRQEGASEHVSTLRDYLHVVKRRKWIIITAAVVVPLVAFAFSLTQSAQYEATAQVLVSTQDLGAQLTGTQSSSSQNPNDLQTQAELARVPDVARQAIAALHLSISPAQFLAETGASASTTSNLISFSATNHDPVLAGRLATAYARAYVRYRFASETAPIAAAQAGLEQRIAETPKGALRDSLIEKQQTLDEMMALKTNDASVVQTAGSAVQTAPKKKRNVLLGFMLGIFLGLGLAFLREALDTRVRSAETIGTQLGLPLLARLPEPPKQFGDNARLAMLGEPKGTQAEAFRVLRTNVEFAALGKDVQTVMVTSAVEKEGKSTTIANLAVALARSGKRVVLVDLDLRRPFIDRFFDLRERGGVTQVAIGHLGLDEALVPVSLSPAKAVEFKLGSVITGSGQVKILSNGNGNGSGNGALPAGSLFVLPSGPIPPDPGEFVGTARLTEILEQLRDRFDVVLIDAPPLFHVGDALGLSAKVDAALVVTRMEVLRRPMLTELRRLLDTMPTSKLGFVVTGAELEEDYNTGHGGYYYQRPYERTLEDEVRV